MLAALLIVGALGAAPAEVPKQTLIFYNARGASREKRPNEVLKLWLLHNTVRNALGEKGTDDFDFLSLVWVALGDLGYCPDGLPNDAKGAGLWPVAVHNWLVRNLVSPPAGDSMAPFDAFEVRKQQRFVSLHDVLSATELRGVTFFRTSCFGPWSEMWDRQEGWPDLKDRLSVAKLMRDMLRLSRKTMVAEKVTQTAAIDARIFDIDVMIAELRAKELRRQMRATQRRAKLLGVVQDGTEPTIPRFAPNSEEGAILRRSLTWSTEEWLSLTQERRLFLFSRAKAQASDPEGILRLELSLLDALIEQHSGAEAEHWIALVGAQDDTAARRVIFEGERGRRLLTLDKDSGFRERAVVALHRGIGFLQAGQLEESLRSFAFALAHASESREERAIMSLSRRWLSYVLSRHQTTDSVITTLKALVPRTDFNAIIDDLVWRAAFTADTASFDLCARNTRGHSAIDTRIARLRPLAQGKTTAFGKQLQDSLADEPFLAMRFVRQFIERLEAESGDVRRAQAPTLVLLMKLLAPLTVGAAPGGSAQQRTATDLTARAQAILDGLGQLEVSGPAKRNPRDLAPGTETYAGAIRLAPSDPLPWPFFASETPAPSIFTKLNLEPVEWRDERGQLVMGWKVSE